MNKHVRNLINLQNAQKSTGPITEAGKQRSSLNALKHGLTGNHFHLHPCEHEEHTRITTEITKELDPQTEIERQLVQKIIDTNMRLNRIAAIERTILNVEVTDAWLANIDTLDKLGRYESRLSRQLLQFTKELDRIQQIRKDAVRKAAAFAYWTDSKPSSPETASFCNGQNQPFNPPPLITPEPDKLGAIPCE
jgi:hypothetical protein